VEVILVDDSTKVRWCETKELSASLNFVMGRRARCLLCSTSQIELHLYSLLVLPFATDSYTAYQETASCYGIQMFITTINNRLSLGQNLSQLNPLYIF
jgi:hypothetical protein